MLMAMSKQKNATEMGVSTETVGYVKNLRGECWKSLVVHQIIKNDKKT